MISVIIPTYERPGKILDAIKSVQSQTFNDLEIIVVDDNGLGTSNQIETEKLVRKIDDPRIVYTAHKINKGGCAARNTGVKKSRGEYVAFLDDDDVWSKHFLEKMLKTLESSSKSGACYCDFYSYDGKYSIRLKQPNSFEGEVFLELLKGWCPASTSLFLVKKDAIIAAGLFDELMPSFQDYDMWLRLSRVTSFSYCNEPLIVKYEGIGEQTSKNPQRRFAGLDALSKKYDSMLSGEEYEVFQRTKEKFYYTALYNRIIYKKAHKISYTEDYKIFRKKYSRSIMIRVRLFMRLHLPKRVQLFVGIFLGRMDGWYYYKGLYSLD